MPEEEPIVISDKIPFGPHGICLADIADNRMYDSAVPHDAAIDEKLKRLNGYIHVRLGHPFLANGETIPCVFMARARGETHLTRRSIACEIAENVAYILSRGDSYDLAGYSLAELKLMELVYDTFRDSYNVIVTAI